MNTLLVCILNRGERHSLLSKCPSFCRNPFLKVSKTSTPEGIVLCKGLGICLSAVGKETSTLYSSGLVEGNRGPVPEDTAKDPASFIVSFLYGAGGTAGSQVLMHLGTGGVPDRQAPRGQPSKLATMFSLIHCLPCWKGEASTEAPDFRVQIVLSSRRSCPLAQP